MKNLHDSFSFLSIVKVLATLRAKDAVFRHRGEFAQRFFEEKRTESHCHGWSEELKCLLPPRRQWSRPKQRQRGGIGTPKDRILRDSIYRKVQGIYTAGALDSVEWGCRLQSFVKEVQQRIGDASLTFQAPVLWIRKKSRSDKGRCVSSYENLSDYVILALTNKYLSSQIDPTFSKDSYAFRTSVKQTYNRAISNLVSFRRHVSGSLYVVNCDLQKLFDVIDHAVLIELLGKRIERLDIDPTALAVVRAYLNSYSYKLVEEKFGGADETNDIRIDAPDWEQVRALHGKEQLDMSQFGVPQGGALSGLLANLLLDEVDQSILRLTDNYLFYARYCDDIIIVHPSKDRCCSALNVCLEKLRELKLPIHGIIENPQYGEDFYRQKSKGPYEWNAPFLRSSAIPWVPFLGYNIRFDGNVRIRKETISRHIDSLKLEFMDFLRHLCGTRLKHGRSREDVIAAFLYRIIRKSIGNRYAGSSREIGRCWLTAFQNVWFSPTALHQLKYVDKKLMSLISMSLSGLGLRFSRVHIGRLCSHVSAARSLNKRVRKNDVSFGLSQAGRASIKDSDVELKDAERIVKCPKTIPWPEPEDDYWPDDDGGTVGYS